MGKIALCIAGQPRHADQGYNNICKDVFPYNDCDVFIHTWHNDKFIGNITSENMSSPYYMVEKYKPVVSIVQKGIDFGAIGVPDKLGMCLGSANMYYSIWKSLQLALKYGEESNVQYDAYIRTRSDIDLRGSLRITDVLPRTLYLNNGYDHGCGYCDHFAYGDKDTMEAYSKTFSFLKGMHKDWTLDRWDREKFWKKWLHAPSGHGLCQEHALKITLNLCGVFGLHRILGGNPAGITAHRATNGQDFYRNRPDLVEQRWLEMDKDEINSRRDISWGDWKRAVDSK